MNINIVYKWNSHDIKFTILKCTVQYTHSAVWWSPLSGPNIFITPEGAPILTKQSLTPPSSPPATTHPLSSSVNLPILDIWYKWYYIVWDLLCLASYTEHTIFEVNPHCSMYQCFIHFIWLKILPCMDTTLCLSIYLLMDIFFFPHFLAFGIVLLLAQLVKNLPAVQ